MNTPRALAKKNIVSASVRNANATMQHVQNAIAIAIVMIATARNPMILAANNTAKRKS